MPSQKEFVKKLTNFLKKYKYVVLVLALGLALLMLPSGNQEEKVTQPESAAEALQEHEYASRIEEQLEQILSRIDGAGQVDVMLTLKRGSLTQYQSDIQLSQGEGEDSLQTSEDKKTVILSEGSAYDKLAVAAVEYPLFQGALVVCSGADKAAVKLDLIQAVTALTGLSSDHITVVKMN